MDITVDLSSLTEIELSRLSQRLHGQINRVNQSREALIAAAPSGSALSEEHQDAVLTLTDLQKRLADHRVDVEREQDERRARIRATVYETREANERSIDAEVAASIRKGEARVAERRAEVLAEAQRKALAYERRVQNGLSAIDARQEEATAALQERVARNDARLQAKRSETTARIAAEAERRRVVREKKAEMVEQRRTERAEELRSRLEKRVEQRAEAPVGSIGASLLSPARVRTRRNPAHREAHGTPPPKTTFDKLATRPPRPQDEVVRAKSDAGIARGEQARADLAESVARKASERHKRFENAQMKVEDERDEKITEVKRREREREMRLQAESQEQQRALDALRLERQRKRDFARARAKSCEPSAHFEEGSVERQFSKALSSMVAVCGELVGHSASSTPPPRRKTVRKQVASSPSSTLPSIAAPHGIATAQPAKADTAPSLPAVGFEVQLVAKQ